jgi:hypothetical protein
MVKLMNILPISWRVTSIITVSMLFTAFAHADSIQDRTVDFVKAGDESAEQAHAMQGSGTALQSFEGRNYRVADTNGWFSWALKVLPDVPQELNIEFGGERLRPANAVDILVDNSKLAAVRLGGGPREEYYLLTNLVKGRENITVRFQAGTGARVGGVAGVSVTKTPPPTIASTSKASSPRTNYQFIVNAVNDQREPKSSGDRLKKHFDWWPAKGTNQWVQYDFARPARISAVEVYWFDDTGIGECRLPKSWQVLYRQNGEWKAVTHASGYGCEGNRYNRTTFDAVETDGLRLDVQLPERFSAGLLQWRVEYSSN